MDKLDMSQQYALWQRRPSMYWAELTRVYPVGQELVSPVVERHRHAGASPVEGRQDGQGAEAQDAQEPKGTRFVQPGEGSGEDLTAVYSYSQRVQR